MDIFNCVKSLFVLCAVSVVITACGSGGGTSTSDVQLPKVRPSGIVSGTSGITNGNIQVYAFTGQKGDVLASGTTDSTGKFSVSVKHTDTPVAICASGGNYNEVASNNSVSGDGKELCAVGLYTSGNPLDTTVSYYTHLGYALASYLAGQGEATDLAVTDANQRIKSMIGFSATTTIPVDISQKSSLTSFPTDADRYGVALAAVSQYTLTVSQTNNTNPHALYNTLSLASLAYDDLVSDGVLDGNGQSGPLSMGSVAVTTDTYRYDIASAMYDVVNASYNATGMVGSDIKSTADTLNMSSDSMYGGSAVVKFSDKPTITMNTAAASLYKGTVDFSFSVTDPYGTPSVDFSINGTGNNVSQTGTDYSASVDTTTFPDGDYTLTIKATNMYGNTQSFTEPLHIFNTPASTYTGLVYDGLIIQGNLVVYDFTGGVKGAQLASTTTDSNGHYSISLLAHASPILLELTGGHYIEEASGISVPLQASQNHILRAVAIHSPGANVAINVTTWTNIAEGLAEHQIANGTDATTAINNANSQISNFLGLDILATTPLDITDVNNAGALGDGLKYGFMSGALSQWTYDLSSVYESSNIQSTVNSINFSMLAYEDIKADGFLDGIGAGSATFSFANTPINANSYRHSLALGMIQMANNINNQTGLKATDIVSYAKSINDSTNGIFNKAATTPLDESGPNITNYQQSGIDGTVTVTSSVSDVLGLVSTDFTLYDQSNNVLMQDTATDPTMPSFTIDTSSFNDCLCKAVFSSTSIDGTVNQQSYTFNIDNIHYLYINYNDGTNGHIGSFAYNVTDGNLKRVDKDIFKAPIATAPNDWLVPNGKYIYIGNSAAYLLDPVTGDFGTSTAVSFNAGVGTAFYNDGSAEYMYTTFYDSTSTNWYLSSYVIGSNGVPKPNGSDITLGSGTVNYYYVYTGVSNPVASIYKNSLDIIPYTISSNGTFTTVTNGTVAQGSITDMVYSKDGKYVYALEAGSPTSKILQYKINPDGTLSFSDSVASGDYANSAVFNKDGSVLYVMNELENTISIYSVAKSNGLLTVYTGPYTSVGSTTDGMKLIMDPSSKYLFVNATDSLIEMAINSDGTLGTPSTVFSNSIFKVNATAGAANAP